MAWLYNHPPFYERMVDAMREIDSLPKKPSYIAQASAFLKMKKELAPVVAKANREIKKRPSLIPHAKGCLAPRKIKQTAGKDIDDRCATELA